MKLALILFFLSGFEFLFAQDFRIDSIEVRWKIIPRNANNELLFRHSDSETNMLDFIAIMALQNEEIFFLEKHDINDKIKYYPKMKCYSYAQIPADSLPNNLIHIHADFMNAQTIVIEPLINQALEDENFYDINVWCNGVFGNICVIYPPKSQFLINKAETEFILIREEKRYDSSTGDSTFVPVGIYLSPQEGNFTTYNCWVDFRRLSKKLISPEKVDWFHFINDKKYVGEQYMQIKSTVGYLLH